MIRWFFILGLLAVAVWRLGIWSSRQQKAAVACHSTAVAAKERPAFIFVGTLIPRSVGHFSLENEDDFGGAVEFSGPVPGHLVGKKVRVEGVFSCVLRKQNPAAIEDGFLNFMRPKFIGNRNLHWQEEKGDPGFASFRSFFIQKLAAFFPTTPGLAGLVHATWTGDGSLLPESLDRQYREGGLLQILALSGQHVVIFLALLSFVITHFLRFFRNRMIGESGLRIYHAIRPFLPVLCSALLFVTSGGLAPVKRTLAMAFAALCLRWRRFECSPLQLTASSTALLIVWEPWLVGNLSFFLSAFATGMLCGTFRSGNYFWVATVMPILLSPLSAFFFGKISWLAPLNQILVAWIWDLIWIPLGFLAPVISFFLPEFLANPLWQGVEKLWNLFVSAHAISDQWIPTTYCSIARPNWWEFLMIETFLLCVISFLRGHLQRWFDNAPSIDFWSILRCNK